MILKRTLSIFLAILMIGMTFTAFPITVNAADVDTAGTAVDQTFTINNAEDLSAAVSEINAATTESNYVIDLRTDLNGCGIAIQNEAKVKVTVTIIGNGHTLFTTSHTLVCVENGATVNLGDGNSTLTLQGDNKLHEDIDDDVPGLVDVWPNSTCVMRNKVTLKDRRGQNYLGGGVTVEGGTFIMDGGTIENCGIDGGSICYGGGVAVFSNGTFIMNEGTITGCYAKSDYPAQDYSRQYTAMGGGVFVTAGSNFTMNGGTISKCEATTFGGGVALVMLKTDLTLNEYTSKGMGRPQSTVTINDGTITGNSADEGAGVFASGYFYAFASGVAYEIPESGSTTQPGLYINGSTISDNKATDMGGGILIAMLRSEIKAQIHNAEIKNNTADNGAGIENFSYWTQLDIDGCTITDNTAASNGGGVMAAGNSSGGFTSIKNTTIKNNTSGNRGAGVYYDADSDIRISGADIIQDNKFNGKLNNLNVYSLDKPVKVIGDLTGSQIGLSDPTLWDDGMEDYNAEAVSTKRLTDGFTANNASLIPANAFTSDHESWIVDYGEKKTEQGAEIGRTYTYTADKYVTNPEMTEGYPITHGAYIKCKAMQLTKKPTNTTDIYKELIYRFGIEYKTIADSSNAFGDDHVYYDSRSKKYITLYQNGNSVVYIWVGSLNDVLRCPFDNSCNLLISGATFFQYGEDGDLILGIYKQPFPGDEPSVLSEAGITLIYDEKINFEGKNTYEDYYLNDLGIVSCKYVIDAASEKEEIQYETITTDYTNEVRLVRKKPDYHINNADIIAAKYNDGKPETDDDIFTSYVEKATGKDVKVGDTIERFYTVPEVVPTDTNSCPYIFKGWYYDQNNENDTRPVDFGNDKYSKDIYAHWIKVDNVTKDENDPTMFQDGGNTYGGFDLAGVQIRKEMRDYNFDDVPKKPGGMRFVTSLSMNVVNQINAIKPNNIEYGYVAATHEGWIDYHREGVAQGLDEKLKYVSDKANGINTTKTTEKNEDYFGFAHNVNCTSRQTNKNGIVRLDHQNFGDYLLYSFVVTYEGEDAARKDTNVLARPYIHYTDANGSERVAYSEYTGASNVLGGCYTNYNTVAAKAGN